MIHGRPGGWHSIFLAAGCLVSAGAQAQVVLSGLYAEPESGVIFGLTGLYDNLPTHGFVPVEVRIQNDSGQSRNWKLDFSAASHHEAAFTHRYAWDVSVPQGAQRAFEVMVPISGRYNPRYTHPSLSISGLGYGLRGVASYYGTSTHSGMTMLPLIAMTPGLSVEYLGPLQGELTSRGKDLRVAAVASDRMSADWRAYVGFESVWMTGQEWAEVRGPVREALLSWVGQGGHLVVATPGGRSVDLPASALWMSDRMEYGLGAVHTPDLTEMRTQVARTADLVERLDGGGWSTRLAELYGRTWPLARPVQSSGVQAAILLIVLFTFAVVVGPVNLIWLAGRQRRWRLFVTTPAISLVASVLMIAAILLQDGLGGSGVRVSLSLMLPELRQVAVFQEQNATTGLLLKRDFALGSEYVLHRLDHPHVTRRAPHAVQRDDRSAGGDWFKSRDVQAHYLSTLQPSRARMELLNAAEVAAGTEAPRLLSTIEQELESLYYTDAIGRIWTGENLRAGESQELRSAEAGRRHALVWWSTHVSGAGIQVRGDLSQLRSRPGYVVAAARAGQGGFIETLPSIRWEDRKQIWIGPCVPAGGAGGP